MVKNEYRVIKCQIIMGLKIILSQEKIKKAEHVFKHMISSFNLKRDAIIVCVNLARPYDNMSEFVTQTSSVSTLK
jgi:hypothetical protein